MDQEREELGNVALDEHLQSIGADFGTALAGSSRTVLVNVDDLIVPARVAHAIGQIVRDVIAYVSDHALGGGSGVVQIACGTNRDGSMTLEITDDGFGGTGARGPSSRSLDATPVPSLVSQLGAHLTVEAAGPGLRCTIVIPANAAG